MIREEIRWELLMPDGRVIEGAGQDAPAGMKLSDLARDALHSRFTHVMGAVVYVSGPAILRWTIQNIHCFGERGRRLKVEKAVRPSSKAIGIEASGRSVWIMPGGAIGIGRTVEEVELAWEVFNVAKKR